MKRKYMKRKHYLKTIVIFARMYGTAETLEPLPFRNQDDTYQMFCKWTTEYLNQKEIDIVAFFEKKIKEM